MTVTFAEKLARIPGYQAGVPTGQAPEAIAAGGIAQLASNESPFRRTRRWSRRSARRPGR